MDPTQYNEWRLVSLSPFPTWALVALALAALGSVWLASRSLRKESRAGRRRLLVVLRIMAAVALVLLLLEPGRRLMQTTRVKNRVAILVDRSGSMSFPAGGGAGSRAQVAQQFLADSKRQIRELSSRFTVELYAFDRELSALDPAQPGALAPEGPGTDLAGAIRQAAAGGGASAGRKLSGIVVVSDGADNAELAGGLTSKARAELKELEVPVSTVAVGGGGVKDLAIEKIAADDFAFVRSTIDVVATVRVQGFGSVDVPVSLKREGWIVSTKTVRMPKDGSYPVTFSFAPDQTGNFVYTVEAPVFEGEAVPTNNARSFALKVIRDRVRVLLVVGRPSWDERFLRGLLKQDPNVDLISFFILRTSNDDPRVSGDHELSLIPFPVREIFQQQLKTFDLVVLQNFSYEDRAYREMAQYVKGIRDYVREGGALVMIGGENSFGEGHWDRTELQEVLPVEPTGAPLTSEPFQARLTAEGARHPVTAVAAAADQSEKAWNQMPELAGVQVTRPRPEASVLLEHPFVTDAGRNVPVVALGEFGRGRSMAIAADSTWLWSFVGAGQGAPVRVYDRFWNNAIRWLVRDPDLTPVKVTVEKPAVEPGEPVAAVISARRPDYGPAAGAQIEVELVHAEDGKALARQSAVAGPDGTARVELEAPKPGAYKVIAKATKDGVALGQGEDVVAVRAAGPELADAMARPELLKEIADATSGAFFERAGELPEVPLIDPETVEVGRRKDLPLWDGWWSLAIIGTAVAAEWALRRRWGYA